ncbi:predicted protein [Histoplasma capsulatum G186AR]|uniref:Uncharacterized protein n=1 Tax=Ajellomyces capsulatus (strain G186AR / H82 / ATCC MYA-2454 / RMSCC 2432) TaxID=447093 RepID=C0NGV0_AJECG|nr:uncharacterized protein HCBG_02572 [Histoplasma capsulatum G186AR]EEH09035.1 predicted protein [Histoplasma capsulatum G186AR]
MASGIVVEDGEVEVRREGLRLIEGWQMRLSVGGSGWHRPTLTAAPQHGAKLLQTSVAWAALCSVSMPPVSPLDISSLVKEFSLYFSFCLSLVLNPPPSFRRRKS